MATFHCTIVTPQQQVLDEPVAYASIPAWDGKIGLAPQRAPLLVKLGDGELRLDYEVGGVRRFFIAGGFAQMKDNRLTVLTEEAVPVESMVRSEVEAAFREANTREARTDEEVIRKLRDVQRARTMLHLLEQQAAA